MWVSVLDAAKDWGRPPWEIAKGSPILWYVRWEITREIDAKVSSMSEEERVLNGGTSND
jgi:hypothetical protein